MWYAASLLMKIIHTEPESEDLWELSIRLIQADTRALAMERAEAMGKQEEVGYVSVQGNRVKWEFVQVERYSGNIR